MHRQLVLLALIVWAGPMVGCGPGGPAREIQPAFDPAGITRGIMERADSDSDGLLKPAELGGVPGLRPVIASLDTNGDGRLSASEITAWLEGIQKSRVAITFVSMEVNQQGRPLANALVRLVPEPFMGPAFQAAEGRTDQSGKVSPGIPGSRFPGVNYCIYRVEITGTGIDGRPIPPQYNRDTTLGLAVGAELAGGNDPTFDLK